MRRVSDERGAVAVIVALLLVPMLAFGALVIDMGAIYEERRELQNGADAAALAIAEECAAGLPTCVFSLIDDTAEQYLDANAGDGAAGLEDLQLDLANQTITVVSATETAGGASQVAYRLLSVVDQTSTGKTVRATARAAWGNPSSMFALPLTMEECEFYKQPLDTPVVLMFHNGGPGTTGTCATNPAGQDGPGNFGWLDTAGACEAVIESGSAAGDTGANPECDPATFEDLLGTTVAIPLFRTVSGTGSNLTYEIIGFGAFRITGYRLGGGPEWNRGSPRPCSGSARCVGGYFTSLVVSTGVIDPDAPDFGLTISKLVPVTEEPT